MEYTSKGQGIMGLIKVDLGKCEKDGACVDVCPMGILGLHEEKGPVVRVGLGQFCIGCGHCVAVCPHGALDNVRNPLAGQLPLEGFKRVEPLQAAVFLRSRRSIRRYKSDPVPRQTLLRLLDIARYAPSGHNNQGLSYLVVDDSESISKISGIVVEWMRGLVKAGSKLAISSHMPGIIKSFERGEDRILRNAPALIAAMAPKSSITGQVSTFLALEYVELYAPALGLGTCWAGFAQACARQYHPLPEFLKVPEDKAVTGMMMVGWPRHEYHRLPDRNPLDVTWFNPQ